MQLVAAGDRALLVELGEIRAEQLHAAAQWARALPGIARVTPGHSSLYIVWSGDSPPASLFRPWPSFDDMPQTHVAPRTIDVEFDGEDLEAFLAAHTLTREAFLGRVQNLTLVARYIGFRAGFAYLDGWPEAWAMPRRSTSRPVRRGSFAIAGSVAGFYPIDSPGGWNVLGHTDEDLVDGIAPGDRLRIAVTGTASPIERLERSQKDPAPPASSIQPPFTLINSPLTRITHDPFDDLLGALALRAVVGNRTLLECPIAGPRIRVHRDSVLAWCDGSGLQVVRARAGDELAFGRVHGGLRGYLAIGEGEGDRGPRPSREDRTIIHAFRGPNDVGLENVECTVTPQLDRVGIRLRPLRDLHVAIPADLRSIGMQCGTVQLHPDGSLVAMGPDHPVTGGYLQPMTVISTERWKLAQLMPGERVLLRATQPPNW